jgi:hypothetical protein
MNFDQMKMNHARDLLKATAALCFNDFEPTPAQLDVLVEYFQLWAEQEQLVNEHLRRVA